MLTSFLLCETLKMNGGMSGDECSLVTLRLAVPKKRQLIKISKIIMVTESGAFFQSKLIRSFACRLNLRLNKHGATTLQLCRPAVQVI